MRKGFILTEMLTGLAIITIVACVFGGQIIKLFTSWRNMQTDVEIFDAGRYMLTKLERELCLDAVEVFVTADNRLQIQTKQGAKQVVVRYNGERMGLYQDTTTNDGTGTNPLFIRDCLVDNWSVKKIDDKKIFVEFALQKNNRKKNFARIFYCLNGLTDGK